jgi:hypothetical protein
VRYDAAKAELTIGGHVALWPVQGGTLGLIVYLDRTCVEVCSQAGLLYAPVAAIPEAGVNGVSVCVEKGTAKSLGGEVCSLRSCWK